MAGLPAGTVSLLFSDVEGSTLLLNRLGPAYAQAVDGQRWVQRAAWVAHGGIELGTEGDSFYVVFPTAEGAVAAATQAQRELAAFSWPGGEQVRVRMGIHTGAPTPHDGAYVGMDVHRAARVAGAAHGGQVLLSSATTELVRECRPSGVTVKDLGERQLKDIAHPEHLFQLVIDGLQSDFPQPKTLGAASSLPRPATPLVGRDGELAELTALVRSPEVRLVTLTGPGGSGKTRLAVGIAERLVQDFPDGVYFVPLAAVSTPEVMWTSIAETLDVPPEGRIPPGFFDHVAHRSALFVLDNLEQIPGADTVVADLLEHAPQAVAIATSRRPLAVEAEHAHPVPPLELPDGGTVEQSQASGAVQLLVARARKVKPAFTLTNENAADVAELCRRLDGLPLALELAAARIRVLSPKALVSRLDKSLDIAAAGSQAPSRQQTLRDTIAWSYDLLAPPQQAFFRRLGVFAGGADLDAVAVVTADILEGADPLDLVTDLVDTSLVTVGENAQGEPRVAMLEMLRRYALDVLAAATEADEIRQRHAEHYVELVKTLKDTFRGPERTVASGSFASEVANFREALTWTLASPAPDKGGDRSRLRLGLEMVATFGSLASSTGYLTEGRAWLEKAIEVGTPEEEDVVAVCKGHLAWILDVQGEHQRGRELSSEGLTVSRRLGNDRNVLQCLNALATSYGESGDSTAARPLLEEGLETAQRIGDEVFLGVFLANLSTLESSEGNLERAYDLLAKALQLYERRGDPYDIAWGAGALAWLLWEQGKCQEAAEQMIGVIPDVLRVAEPGMLIEHAEDCVVILGTAEPVVAAQLLGAAEAMREREGRPRTPRQADEFARSLTPVKQLSDNQTWNRHYQLGRQQTVTDLLAELVHKTATA